MLAGSLARATTLVLLPKSRRRNGQGWPHPKLHFPAVPPLTASSSHGHSSLSPPVLQEVQRIGGAVLALSGAQSSLSFTPGFPPWSFYQERLYLISILIFNIRFSF